MVFAVSSPELTAVASSFPLAGNGGNPASVDGYYWSATTSYDTRYDAYYLGLLPSGSSVTTYGEGLYSVRCVRIVTADEFTSAQ